MSDVARALLDHAEGFRWLLLAALVWTMIRVVNDPNNDLEWMEFISVKGADGKNHPSWDQVGKGVAVVIGAYSIVAILPFAKSDLKGFAVVMFTYFTYAGAVNGYAAYLRSKSGQTVTITEPAAPPPGPTKTTVIESGLAPAPKNGKQGEEQLSVSETPQGLRRKDE